MKKLTETEYQNMTDADYSEARDQIANAAKEYADRATANRGAEWNRIYLGRVDQVARELGIVR